MIIVCEPQCFGFEHAEVNAALLLVVAKAYPNEKVLFLAENEHIHHVRQKIGDDANHIEYKTILIPHRHLINRRRFMVELRLVKKVFQYASRNKVEKLMFSSITSPGLISIKILQRFFPGLYCVVTPHGILETIKTAPPITSSERIFWFRYALIFGNTDKIRYLVLGPSIAHELLNYFPAISKNIITIDLPYFFKDNKCEVLSFGEKSLFGSLGVGHRDKGVDMFFSLADEIKTRAKIGNSQFILIGPITDPSLNSNRTESVLIPSPDQPLSREDFERYAESIDYAVFCYPRDSYQLRASGALFDAFSFAKPVIALRNAFFEHYFKIMGDIGYLCDSYEELKAVVQELCYKRDIEHYKLQRDNILQGRKILSIEHISKKLVDQWEEAID